MVSLHKNIGVLSQKRAMFLVFGGLEKRGRGERRHLGLKARQGKFVKLGNRKKVIAKAKRMGLDNFIISYSKRIAEEANKKGQSKILTKLLSTRSLLQSAIELGIEKPSSLQLVSVLAYQHGLKKEQLLEHVKALYSIERSRSSLKFWNGTASSLVNAINWDLPFKIEKLLRKNKSILDSSKIFSDLGIKETPNTRLLVTTSLQLLNQMGVIIKHPLNSKNYRATFSHKSHGMLEINYPNTLLEILTAVSANHGGQLRTVLHRPGKTIRGTIGKTHTYKTIKRDAQELIDLGLITESKSLGKDKIARDNNALNVRYELTVEGKRLMDKFNRLGKKSFSELRTYLLRE